MAPQLQMFQPCNLLSVYNIIFFSSSLPHSSLCILVLLTQFVWTPGSKRSSIRLVLRAVCISQDVNLLQILKSHAQCFFILFYYVALVCLSLKLYSSLYSLLQMHVNFFRRQTIKQYFFNAVYLNNLYTECNNCYSYQGKCRCFSQNNL